MWILFGWSGDGFLVEILCCFSFSTALLFFIYQQWFLFVLQSLLSLSLLIFDFSFCFFFLHEQEEITQWRDGCCAREKEREFGGCKKKKKKKRVFLCFIFYFVRQAYL